MFTETIMASGHLFSSSESNQLHRILNIHIYMLSMDNIYTFGNFTRNYLSEISHSGSKRVFYLGSIFLFTHRYLRTLEYIGYAM